MLYAINVIRSGFIVGFLSFLVWSLPGAVAAYGPAVGISRVSDTLPAPVYALISGLNGATVGIIALAAVQLSGKAITDKLTRLLVLFGGTAGMLYNALWYFPVLTVAGELSTVIWDYRWQQRGVRTVKRSIFGRHQAISGNDEEVVTDSAEMQVASQPSRTSAVVAPDDSTARRIHNPSIQPDVSPQDSSQNNTRADGENSERLPLSHLRFREFSWKLGAPLGFSLFANLYLAGTIIFRGGPVVIPLLRKYVEYEGWVSPRDFLLGLAIQAFPAPNFNFAVYLGALAVSRSGTNPAAGALIGYIAIFSPGLVLYTGTMGIWKVMRQQRWVISGLRGINVTAVGLIYAAVYRLWELGFLSADFQGGSSLGKDPWWVVVTAMSFVGGMWFGVEAPLAILMGGVMGMIWYGAVTR